MLTRRIIPCLDVKAGRVVKGVKFLHHRDAGDPVELAAAYNEAGADELVFYEITASSDERSIMSEVVKRTAEQVFIPLTVGGGLRSTDDMYRMLRAGADKVSINTAAVLNPQLIEDGAKRFGSQCIMLSVDAQRVNRPEEAPRWAVFTHTGRDPRPTGRDAIDWIRQAVELGAGEICINSMDADGQRSGYDLDLLRAVNAAVHVPVIASGGVGSPHDMYLGVVEGQADAVLAASIFHFGDYSIADVKDYLRERGVPTRI